MADSLAEVAFADLALWQLASIAAATFLASLVSGIGGFGGGFVIAIALTPIVGAKSLVPLLSVFAFFSNISRVLVYWRTIRWPTALLFLLASMPGVFAGTNFYLWVAEEVLLVVLGLSLILAIPLRRYLARRRLKPGLRTLVAAALLFGFISGSAVGSGTVVIATLLSTGLQGPWLLGTDAAIGLVNALTRAVTFYHFGALPPGLLIAGSMMGIMTLPGTYLAKRVVTRMELQLHTLLMETVIVCGGVFFILSALSSQGS